MLLDGKFLQTGKFDEVFTSTKKPKSKAFTITILFNKS